MTIDFTNNIGYVYFYGVLATYNVYALKFKSKYSNRYLYFGEDDYIRVTEDTQYGTKYYRLKWDISELATALEDVAGYYYLEFYGGADVGSLTLLTSTLAKVEQNNFDIPVEVEYVSDNDDNEQIIYFYENI